MSIFVRFCGLGALLICVAVASGEPGPVSSVLPDAPGAQQALGQAKAAQSSTASGTAGSATNTSAQTAASAPSLFSAPDTVPLGQLGLHGKFVFYLKSEFGPANFAIPAAGALYRMANPPNNYPHRWRDGGGAFGRNYGDILASDFSEKTGRFMVGAILREEPRYFSSENRSFGGRAFHAIRFTLIDKADSGHDRIAISNFAGAAAGGFIGDAYLPPGYRSVTHAGQRSMLILAGIAGENEAAEFRPEIRSILKKLHVPFIK